MMDLTNKIAIPTVRIEDILREGAVPGFWGTITIQVRLNQNAALEVDLLTEKTSHSDGSTKTREVSNVIAVNNGRYHKVKMKIAELRDRLNIFCPVTHVEAIFQDGDLVRFSVTEVKEPAEPRMRFAPAVPQEEAEDRQASVTRKI